MDNLLVDYTNFTVGTVLGMYDSTGCDLYSGLAINLSKGNLYGLTMEYIYGGSQIYEEKMRSGKHSSL